MTSAATPSTCGESPALRKRTVGRLTHLGYQVTLTLVALTEMAITPLA